MARVRDLLLFPFVALLRLIELLILPAAALALMWLIFGADSTPFRVAALVCVPFAALMVILWRNQLRGRVRSLGRGSVRVRTGQGRSDHW